MYHSLSLASTDSNEQVPAICVHGVYYSLSLRMMRSIWRHVRLRKGFVNQERAPFGGLKLRIPSLLYSDKIRTQTRFMVGSAVLSLALHGLGLGRALARALVAAVFGVSRAPV